MKALLTIQSSVRMWGFQETKSPQPCHGPAWGSGYRHTYRHTDILGLVETRRHSQKLPCWEWSPAPHTLECHRMSRSCSPARDAWRTQSQPTSHNHHGLEFERFRKMFLSLFKMPDQGECFQALDHGRWLPWGEDIQWRIWRRRDRILLWRRQTNLITKYSECIDMWKMWKDCRG